MAKIFDPFEEMEAGSGSKAKPESAAAPETSHSQKRIFDPFEELAVAAPEVIEPAEEPGRLLTAASQLVSGAGHVVSSVPKTVAMLQASDSDLAQTAISAMDRVDRGEEVNPGESLELDRVYSSYVLPYINASPERRAAMRAPFENKLSETAGKTKKQIVTENPLYVAGRDFDSFMSGLIDSNPKYKEEFWAGKVPQGIGSTVGFLVAAALTGPAGASSTGAMAGAVEGFEDALDRGASIEDALDSAKWNAAIGTTEAVPIARLLKRLDKGTGGLIRRSIVNALKQGTEEAIQEAFQQITGNLVASDIVKYDPKRGMFSGSGEASGVGFTTGGLMGFLGTLVAGRRGRSAPVAQTPPPAATAPSGPLSKAVKALPAPTILVKPDGTAYTEAQGEANQGAILKNSLDLNRPEPAVEQPPIEGESEVIQDLPEFVPPDDLSTIDGQIDIMDKPVQGIDIEQPQVGAQDASTIPSDQAEPDTTGAVTEGRQAGGGQDIEETGQRQESRGTQKEGEVKPRILVKRWQGARQNGFLKSSAEIELKKKISKEPKFDWVISENENLPDGRYELRAYERSDQKEDVKKTASWVIRDKATGKPVLETFDEKKVAALNTSKYEAVPILEHLQEVNRKIKGDESAAPKMGTKMPKSGTPTFTGKEEPAYISPSELARRTQEGGDNERAGRAKRAIKEGKPVSVQDASDAGISSVPDGYVERAGVYEPAKKRKQEPVIAALQSIKGEILTGNENQTHDDLLRLYPQQSAGAQRGYLVDGKFVSRRDYEQKHGKPKTVRASISQEPKPADFSDLSEYTKALRKYQTDLMRDADLRAAIRLPDGKVMKGEVGEGHANVIVRHKLFKKQDGEQDGFVDKGGKFYSRAEAMQEFGINDSAFLPLQEVRASIKDPTETTEFKKWFSGSKVVDESGNPLVVYHGTKYDIENFITDRKKRGERGVVFFTDSEKDAEEFSYMGGKSGDPNIMPVYLSIKNPMKVNAGGDLFYPEQMQKWINDAKDGEFDGLIVRNIQNFEGSEPTTTFVVFDSKQVKSATGNRGAFDPKSPNILESRHGNLSEKELSKSEGRLTHSKVTERTLEIMRDWADAPVFEVVDSAEQLPSHVKSELKNRNALGLTNAVFVQGEKPIIYLVAPNFTSYRHLESVIAHEVIGHYGLRKSLGKKLNPILDQVYELYGRKRLDSLIKTYFKKTPFDPTNVAHRRLIAEEKLAHMVERGEKPGILKKLYGIVREWLRKMGFKLNLNDADVHGILRGARKAVETAPLPVKKSGPDADAAEYTIRGEHGLDDSDPEIYFERNRERLVRQARIDGKKSVIIRNKDTGGVYRHQIEDRRGAAREDKSLHPMASVKGDQTKTAAFKKWFKKSKVVDEKGKPLVVYHGSGTRINRFDFQFTDKGNDQLGSGFYFTTDRSEAESYTTRTFPGEEEKLGGMDEPTVHEVYLSIQKPLDVDAIGRITKKQAKEIIEMSTNLEDDLSNWGDIDYEGMDKVLDTASESYAINGSNILQALHKISNDFFREDIAAFNKAVRYVLGYDGVVATFGPGNYQGGRNHWVAWFPEQIKSIENRGGFSPTSPNIMESIKETGPIFFSEMERKLDAKLPNSGTVAQLKQQIENLLKNGEFKKEEYEWVGIGEWMDSLPKDQKLSKKEIVDFARENGVQVEEVEKGGEKSKFAEAKRELAEAEEEVRTILHQNNFNNAFVEDVIDMARRHFDVSEVLTEIPEEIAEKISPLIKKIQEIMRWLEESGGGWAIVEGGGTDTKYDKYTLPGGANYRELLLTVPSRFKPAPAPEPITSLPDGYELIRDMTAPENKRWGIVPPGQDHARPFSGMHPTEDAAVSDAIEKLNAERKYAHDNEERRRRKESEFTSGHWSEPNIVAHVRFNEHQDQEGKRVIFLEEIQSDFAQKGRDVGFREPINEFDLKKVEWSENDYQYFGKFSNGKTLEVGKGVVSSMGEAKEYIERLANSKNSDMQAEQMDRVPPAPFVTKTPSWTALVLKRMIRYAAENGFDRIAWTTGEQQSERWNKLIRNVKIITWNERTGILDVWTDEAGRQADSRRIGEFKDSELDAVVGKDVADRLRAERPDHSGWKRVDGLDIKVGGEGFNAFYDRIVPNVANDVSRKLGGGKVQKMGLDIFGRGSDGYNVVTPDGDYLAGPFRTMDAAQSHIESSGVPDKYGKIEPSLTIVNSLDLTPEMRERALQGQPMFSIRGGMDEEVKKGYRERAKKIIEKIDNFMDPLGNLPDKKNYLKKRYQTLGRIAKFDQIAKDIRAVFSKATDEDKKAAYEYFTTRGTKANTIKDEDVRHTAERTKRNIERVGDALVEHGLLSEESREAHRGEYLPRIYLKYLLDDSSIRTTGTGKKPSDMGYLKARKDIPEDVRRLILGEIVDPAFLSASAIAKPMRDIAIIDWLNDMATTKNDWVMPKSVVKWEDKNVSPFWLKEEAARIRKQADYYTEEDSAKAREIAKKMDAIADEAITEIQGTHEDYQQIPNTKRFGYLRGMYVRKEIHNDIVGSYDIVSDKSWPEKILGHGGVGTKATQLWKMSKVSLNPPAQVRNFVSNMVLLQMSGVPGHKIPKLFMRAVDEIRNDGKFWKIAKKYGVTESTFSAQELFRIRRDLLDLEKHSGNMSWFGKAKHMVAIGTEHASDTYQFMEAMGKTMKIMDSMEREKLDEADAAIEAQKWLFDYSLVPKSVRWLRNAPIGSPFLTFTYKVLPRLIEVAALHPQRYAPYAAILFGLPYLFAYMNDVDKEDWDKLKEAMPEWLQSKGHAMILPFKDGNGRWQVLDLGYFFPWTAWIETAKSLAKFEPREAAKNLGLLAGPIPDLMIAWRTGKDPFTGRDIVNPGDPFQRRALSMLNYMWSMAAPSFVTDRGTVGKELRAITKETDKYGSPRSTHAQAALSFLGVNVYGLEPERTRIQNIQKLQRDIEDTQTAMKYKLQDRSLREEKKKAIREEYTKEIRDRQKKMTEYMQESEIHPKLKTGH